MEGRKSVFVGFWVCLFIFYLCSLYQELILIIFLKIIYITVIDSVFFFLTVQLNLLSVNVWKLVRALSDNRIYGANPRDVFIYRTYVLNHDTTEIRGSLPIPFIEVRTLLQIEEQYRLPSVVLYLSL